MSIEELTVEVTHECPLDCIHCSSKNNKLGIDRKDELSISKVEELVEKYNPNIIRWSGGEPFSYLDDLWLGKFDDYKQIVTTSGCFETQVGELVDYFDEVRFSIYGYSDTHNRITQTSGSFMRVMKTLTSVMGEGYNLVITSPVFGEEQKEEVLNIANGLELPTRITGLVPVNNLDRKYSNGNTCSLGSEGCNYEEKRLVLPNGKVINCAVEKLGYDCPYMGD